MNKKYLNIKELIFQYQDGSKALNDVNFSVQKGEFVGILGGNGSGKTTLLKVMNRLLKPEAGSIYLEEQDVRMMKKDVFFRRMCTMFQNPDDQLFSPTVIEDVSFGPNNMSLSNEEVFSRARKALDDVGMGEYCDKAIHHLSYGQKKRVCLAGVLAMRPEIMLLDEPTSCLDPQGVSTIMDLLKGLNEKYAITMVMATHEVDLVPLFFDRIIVLHEGQVIYDGTPREVFRCSETLDAASLRLPIIGQLFEKLQEDERIALRGLPLTVKEGCEKIRGILV